MSQEKESKGLKKIFSGAGGDKYKNIIIIIGLAGIALIFLSSFLKPVSKEEKTPVVENTISAEQYTKALETSLTDIVSSIDGAGATKVLITLENGVEMKYATDEKKNAEETQEKSSETTRTQQSGDSEIKYITVRDADGTERALAITEIQPTVKGVVVVCAGGEDPVVQQRILNAVTTALNISSKRVCVTRLS